MLLWSDSPRGAPLRTNGQRLWFAWRPVRTVEGWVWLEQVVAVPWDCWGAGGWNYFRIPEVSEWP